MVKNLLVFLALISFSCSSYNSINEVNPDNNKTQLLFDKDSAKIEFYNRFNSLVGTIEGLSSPQLLNIVAPQGLGIISPDFICINGSLVNINKLEVEKEIKARTYKSASGSIGKTYTEEFKDLEGNTRTRVYENGLLVSYKINGVEQ